ncbi:MAG: polysaccharide deacetylase family protein [Deltaproteobacteria bacterium]|nr:polysaccharide deacetylase family protein [Deltaproteobacteria bacterium]
MKRAVVTLDVDPSWVYRGIHGLTGPELSPDRDPIYTIALPRFFELLAAPATPATLFLVGRDLPTAAPLIRPALELEHELASHSFSHDHALSTWPKERIDAELDASERALTEVFGIRVRGFRAPGYNTSPTLLSAVERRRWYDSSLLPAPAYFLARGGILAVYKTLGRPSRSQLGDPRQFLGPLEPYRTVPRHVWKSVERGALVELPMSVDPLTRVPMFGTALSSLPSAFLDPALKRTSRLSTVVLEFHAIDFLDESDHPTLRELARSQKDLTISFVEKQRRYSAALGTLRTAGALFTTLARVADTLDGIGARP